MFRLWPSPDECRAGRDGDEGFGDCGELLVVASEAPVLHDPGEGSLDDPAPWQNLEALGRGVTTDDLQRDVGFVLCLLDEAARVAAIGVGSLHEGEPRSRALQNSFATVPVLDVGAVDVHGEQPAIGVGQDVALASADLLAGIIAFRAPL